MCYLNRCKEQARKCLPICFDNFRNVLLFGDLKSRLFQAYKEIGNAFAFMHMLNDHWIVTDHNNFMASALSQARIPSTEVIKLDMRAYTDGENVMDVDALSKLAPLVNQFMKSL